MAATGEPDVVAALMQAENMRPNAPMHVDFLSKWKRTSVTDNAGAPIATLCYFIISAVGNVKPGNKLISLYSQSVCGFGRFRPKTAHG